MVAINMSTVKDPKTKHIYITLYCKRWSLQYEYKMHNINAETDVCSLCGNDTETYIHILCKCRKIYEIVEEIYDIEENINQRIIANRPIRDADLIARSIPL